VLIASLFVTGVFAQIPAGALASNVRVVGYSEVDGRPPFKLSIQPAQRPLVSLRGSPLHRAGRSSM